MQRRTLLRRALAAVPGFGFGGRLFAAGDAGDARFLLVFLRGGYDAASLLVPTGSSFYYEARPSIAIARPDDGAGEPSPDRASPLAAGWGLHPALNDSVLALARRGQAAFVPFAGTHDASRSHFETQDSIELGQPPGAAAPRDFGSGFMNRLAVELGAAGRSIAFTDRLPLALRGAAEIANVSLRVPDRQVAVDARTRALLSDMYRGHALGAQVEQAFGVRDEVAREAAGAMTGEMAAAGRGAVGARGFEAEARRIARLMRERYAIGFVDAGGWDTHIGQGAAAGYLATRLAELGRGLAAYADELGEPAWRRSVVVVASEFGRTLRENGNRGTDHGHGSVYWVLGGGLAAGPAVAGEQVAVEARTLFQNRDWPVLNEYRALLGGLLRRQFGLSPAALGRVFPGAEAADLRLL